LNPRPKTVSRKLIHAYPLVLSSRLIRRLGESFGIGQPGFSYPPAPDDVGKTSLVITSLRPFRRPPRNALPN
jgi:hypothetical protein